MAKNDINFPEFIQTFRRGDLMHQADEKLQSIIEAMRETGGNGTLTIKFPFKMNKAGQIECTPTLDAKIPTKPMGTGIYYATDDGKLSRSDPNQMDFEDELLPRRTSGAPN